MATTTILTSKQHIPALFIDSEQRTLSFEFGAELTEFVYSIPADKVSMAQLLGEIQNEFDIVEVQVEFDIIDISIVSVVSVVTTFPS